MASLTTYSPRPQWRLVGSLIRAYRRVDPKDRSVISTFGLSERLRQPELRAAGNVECPYGTQPCSVCDLVIRGAQYLPSYSEHRIEVTPGPLAAGAATSAFGYQSRRGVRMAPSTSLLCLSVLVRPVAHS